MGLIVFCSLLSNKGGTNWAWCLRFPTSATPDSCNIFIHLPRNQEILLQASFIGDFGSKAHSLPINNR